jgi:hypothetical protein
MIQYQELCLVGNTENEGDECYKKVLDKIRGLNPEKI